MPSTRSPLPGILLIVLGLLFLIANISDVHLDAFWPVFVIGPGVAFLVLFFRDRKDLGLLMPGSILTMVGLLFFACTLYGWDQMNHLWPLFMMAPGVGFVMMYLFGRHERGFLIPAVILIGLGLVFLLDANESEYLWPILLIVAGLLFLIRWKKEPSPGAPQGPVPPAQ